MYVGGRHSDVGDTEFDIRSFLRRKERFIASNPQCDSHVRMFISTYTPTQRQMWRCPQCGKTLRRGDRAFDADGHRKKTHCGCRTGVPGRLGYSKYGIKPESKAEWKKVGRQMGLPGFKPSKHDSHVKEFKRRRSELMELEARQRAIYRSQRVESPEERRKKENAINNERTKNLSDCYVSKRLKKNMPLLNGSKGSSIV